MQVLHAGYVSGAVWPQLGNLTPPVDWRGVMEELCHFVVDKDLAPKPDALPELSVLENLISRGLPTLPSLRVEKWIADTSGLTLLEKSGDPSKGTEAFSSTLKGKLDHAQLERAWCISAPGASENPSPGFLIPEPGSKSESAFWDGPLRILLGESLMQWVECQRPVGSITEESAFQQQSVDFSINLPGCDGVTLRKGVVFEYDGAQHLQDSQRQLDLRRDAAFEKAGWCRTVRYADALNQQSIPKADESVRHLLSHPLVKRLHEKTDGAELAVKNHSPYSILALSPLAIARIQKVFVRLIRAGILDLNKPVWRILVVERDVPCGEPAIEDVVEWLQKLMALYSPSRVLPEIKLHVVASDHQVAIPEDWPSCDVGIDVSVLLRYGLSYPDKDLLLAAIPAAQWIRIRSGYRASKPRKLERGPVMQPGLDGSAEEAVLQFFLRNIFRKGSFRDGQIRIIQRLIRGKSVVALLPTGSGKSLTYQLPALLQNGQVLVVDPIKSLMKDQDAGLRRNAIDSSVFIYSSGDPRKGEAVKERKRKLDGLKDHQFKFAFVSPERMWIQDFRKTLEDTGGAFCFAVIDESHCVSEWGHDFRTSYLMLGQNLRKHCRPLGSVLPIAALTGTASFEVLEDVQRELHLTQSQDPDHTIRPEQGMTRPELEFRVIQVATNPTKEAKPEDTDTSLKVKKFVGLEKQNVLKDSMNKIAQELGVSTWENLVDPHTGSAAGLVFCPHRSWVFGARDIAQLLAKRISADTELPPLANIGCYMGADDSEETNSAFSTSTAEEVQEDFSSGKLTLLACTKAFGMGIDKANIRFTVHINIPQSPESFYQEAGRAGRDRERALCWILYSGLPLSSGKKALSVDRDIVESFHDNSFRGEDHDIRMLFGLLDRIRFPADRVMDRLAQYLSAEIELNITCKLKNVAGVATLSIIDRDSGETLGAMICHANAVTPQPAETENPDNAQVLLKAAAWISANKKPNAEVKRWLRETIGMEDKPGIQAILDDLEASGREKTTIRVPFTNGYFRELHEVFNAGGHYGWWESYLEEAYEFSHDAASYLKRLDEVYYKHTKTRKGLPMRAIDFINKNYAQMCRRLDTFRAIHRLVLLGAVEDFTVDYNAEIIEVVLRRAPKGTVTKHLDDYFSWYAHRGSRSHQELMRAASRVKESTELRRCAKALILFVYDKIEIKRRQNIATMEEYTKAAITDQSVFHERINNFFDSRYTDFLRKWKDDYTSADVFEIIKVVSADLQNVKQLLGSCDRLLIEKPDNGVYHALRAYALAAVGKAANNYLLEALAKAGKDLFGRKKSARKDLHAFLLKLREQVFAANQAGTSVFDVALLNSHKEWLRGFNKHMEHEV